MNLVRKPLYQQLHELLRKEIREGKIKPGEQFPTERELAQKYNVSRSTANKVVSGLVSEELVEFKKGIGTFVKENVKTNFSGIFSFTEKVKNAGKVPSSKIILFQTIKAAMLGPEIVRQMNITNLDTDVYELKRLRFADNVPMIFSHRFILSEYCPGLEKQDFEGSFFALLQERYNITIAGSDDVFRPVIIDDQIATLLQGTPGEAGFLSTNRGFLDDKIILWLEFAVHRPDGFEFRCQTKPMPNNKFQNIDYEISDIL